MTRRKGAKLTEAQVAEILALRGKLSQRRSAVVFGTSQGQVNHILRGKRWGDVPTPPP